MRLGGCKLESGSHVFQRAYNQFVLLSLPQNGVCFCLMPSMHVILRQLHVIDIYQTKRKLRFQFSQKMPLFLQ